MTVTQAENDLQAPSAVIAGYLRNTISLSYLVGLAWAGKLIVVACTAAGFLFGVYTAYEAGPMYLATIQVSPAPGDTGTPDPEGAGGLLAGLSGGSGAIQVPKFIQFLYAMNSVEVARILDQRYDLLCRVYYGDCNAATHHWKARSGIREWITSETSRLGGFPDPNVGPRGIEDLAQYVESQVLATQLKKTDSVYAITYKNRDSQFAA